MRAKSNKTKYVRVSRHRLSCAPTAITPMSLSRILNDPPPHQNSSPPDMSPPPRRYSYQPVNYQGTGGWDPYTGNYVQGDIFPLGPGGNYYPQRDVAPTSSEPQDGSVSAYYKEAENDHASKKRRKAANDDPDYQPPAPRRVCLLFLIYLLVPE